MNHANRAARAFALAAACLLPALTLAQASDRAQESSTNPSKRDTPADYSHVLPLTVKGKQGVFAFRLPQVVYLHARTAGLHDLHLFDAKGAPVPFALHVPPVRQQVREHALPVRIFPLAARERVRPGEQIAFDVRTADDGTLLSVTTRSASKTAQVGESVAPLAGLVLDVAQPADKLPVKALRFTLPASRTAYSAQVWLEVSDDLKQWDTIGATELSWLVNDETQTLANDSMEFEPRAFRYARLTWRSGEPVQFASITAQAVERTGEAPALDTVLLQPEPGKIEHDLVYRAGIALPVERIGLQFDEGNVVLPAAFGYYERARSRSGKEKSPPFRTVARTNFYRITQDGKERRSGDIGIPRTHQAEWVLRPQGALTVKPTLRLSWQPATLVFLANGAEPYALAFGRTQARPVQMQLSQVAPGFTLDELGRLAQASAGPLKEQEVAAATRTQAAEDPAQMRKWILWGVLLLGVAVLAVLARSLVRQMK